MQAHAAILSPFTASDGENIALRDWPLPHGAALRGVVVLVHGLGEHAGRYEALASRLNAWGYAVRGYDQYGHGESSGARGNLPAPMRLIEDLADVLESTRLRFGTGAPLIVNRASPKASAMSNEVRGSLRKRAKTSLGH